MIEDSILSILLIFRAIFRDGSLLPLRYSLRREGETPFFLQMYVATSTLVLTSFSLLLQAKGCQLGNWTPHNQSQFQTLFPVQWLYSYFTFTWKWNSNWHLSFNCSTSWTFGWWFFWQNKISDSKLVIFQSLLVSFWVEINSIKLPHSINSGTWLVNNYNWLQITLNTLINGRLSID